MSTKRLLMNVLIVSLVLLAVGAGTGTAQPGQMLPTALESTSPATSIPYPGHLSDPAGLAVADGLYDFGFALYEASSGGTPLWSEAQDAVPVQDGAFLTLLGSIQPIEPALLDGRALWLAVQVRGPGEEGWTTLAPRQRLSGSSPAAPANPAAGQACAHDHVGEWWETEDLNGLAVENKKFGGNGLYGTADEGVGAAGVKGRSYSGRGVYGYSVNGIGVGAYAAGSARFLPALRAENTNAVDGMAAYFTNKSGYHNTHLDNSGTGGVLFLQNNGDTEGTGGGDFISAVSRGNDTQFRVTSSGEARSDVGFSTPAADFAEMLPAAGGSEPGDVLVIGADGRLTRSTGGYQASVAGVYSTQPGFVGGMPVDGGVAGAIPLAVVGIVPVKVTDQNGPIQPGELLVSSSTPGHAMRAGSDPPQGTVIGKALEALDSGSGVIQMLATLQ